MEYRKKAQIYFHGIQNNIVDFGIEALTSIYMAFVQWVTETCFWISIFCHENLTANLDTKYTWHKTAFVCHGDDSLTGDCTQSLHRRFPEWRRTVVFDSCFHQTIFTPLHSSVPRLQRWLLQLNLALAVTCLLENVRENQLWMTSVDDSTTISYLSEMVFINNMLTESEVFTGKS